MGSCPARQTKRNFDTRLFGFDKNQPCLQNLVNTVQQNRFQTCGRFMTFGRFFEKTCFVPEVPQKCLGGVWDHPRRIRDQFWTILDQHRVKQNIRKFPI